MTEEEAKTRWCPMARTGDEHDRCITSSCMMWREIWLDRDVYKFTPNPDGSVTCADGPSLIGGYCGLAGKP